jgi:hypothetical protein
VYDQAEGMVVLAASSARQMAVDTKIGGLFTHYFVQGLTQSTVGTHLNADTTQSGVVTVHEIATYTSAQVRLHQVKQGAGRRVMLPTTEHTGHGEMPFVDRR